MAGGRDQTRSRQGVRRDGRQGRGARVAEGSGERRRYGTATTGPNDAPGTRLISTGFSSTIGASCADRCFRDRRMKLAIGVSYCGTGLEGWQSQPSGNTRQDHLAGALAEVGGEPIAVTGAGRTDAGVHASAQVAHFETSVERPESAWVRGANSLLPEEIAVQWATPVPGDFHARYSALSRSYRFAHPLQVERQMRPPGAPREERTGWSHLPLDLERMRKAVDLLVGEHDFSSFRSAECQAKSPVRIIQDARIRASGAYLLFDFTANAFLHHMVRNIVGCLVYVGKGKHPPQWIAELIAAQDRRLAAPTFSAEGLYLFGVRYDARWNLPAFTPMMPFDLESGR